MKIEEQKPQAPVKTSFREDWPVKFMFLTVDNEIFHLVLLT
jgi:hypothetical protein